MCVNNTKWINYWEKCEMTNNWEITIIHGLEDLKFWKRYLQPWSQYLVQVH